MPRVYLKKSGRTEEFRRWISELPFKINPGARIFIKPNVVCPVGRGTGVVTDCLLVEALIEDLKSRGAAAICIGEGPGLGVDAWEAFRVSGFRSMARRQGVELLDLDRAPRRMVECEVGRIGIPEVLQGSYYINFPKMKTHVNTLVSLGLKNQKGLLAPVDKKAFHRMGLHRPVAVLLKAARPDFTILDGMLALEGDGPLLGGRRVRMNVLAAGDDPLAVDATGCRLMGFEPSEVEHLRIASGMGLGTLDPEISGDSLERCRLAFRRPRMDCLKILNLRSHRTPLACSMCGGTAREALVASARSPGKWFRSLAPVLWNMAVGGVSFVYGSKAEVPEGAGRTIAVGDCAGHLRNEPGVLWVAGCPPSPEMLAEAFGRLWRKDR